MRLVVHVDGGSRGNPGPAAAAAVASTPDGEVVDETAVAIGRTTNNVAEYRALLLGLDRARALGATEVEVVNDSELVAKQVNGEYRVKNPEMAALHGEATRALEGFERWTLRSVPRAQNAAADALVNHALDAPERGYGVRGLPSDRRPPRACSSRSPRRRTTSCCSSSSTSPTSCGSSSSCTSSARPATSSRRAGPRRPSGRSSEPWRSSGSCSTTSTCSRRWVLRASSSSGTRWRPRPASSRGSSGRSSRSALSSTTSSPAQLPTDLADLYRNHLDDPVRALLHEVAELLVDHDEQIALWRHHHTLMAAREIGSRTGTGGSRGVEYLQGTQGKRFYPELWDVRSAL